MSESAREVLRAYILSVPLAAMDDDGSKKLAAMKALAALQLELEALRATVDRAADAAK